MSAEAMAKSLFNITRAIIHGLWVYFSVILVAAIAMNGYHVWEERHVINLPCVGGVVMFSANIVTHVKRAWTTWLSF